MARSGAGHGEQPRRPHGEAGGPAEGGDRAFGEPGPGGGCAVIPFSLPACASSSQLATFIGPPPHVSIVASQPTTWADNCCPPPPCSLHFVVPSPSCCCLLNWPSFPHRGRADDVVRGGQPQAGRLAAAVRLRGGARVEQQRRTPPFLPSSHLSSLVLVASPALIAHHHALVSCPGDLLFRGRA